MYICRVYRGCKGFVACVYKSMQRALWGLSKGLYTGMT